MTTAIQASRVGLEAFVSESRELNWQHLSDAIDRAVNHAWSMEASNFARQIVTACRLVGVNDYNTMPWHLVVGGVYDAVLEAGGLEAPPRDEGDWVRAVDLMASHVNSERMVLRYAATVAAIRTPRETSWIGGGDE